MNLMLGAIFFIPVAWAAACLSCAAIPRLRRFAAYLFLPPAGALLLARLSMMLPRLWRGPDPYCKDAYDHHASGSEEAFWASMIMIGLSCGLMIGAFLAPRLNARLGLRTLGIYDDPERRSWWEGRRRVFNLSMAASGLAAFVLGVAFERRSTPWVGDGLVWFGTAYAAFMGAANVCYFLGPALESALPPDRLTAYRLWSYWGGLLFLCGVPAVSFALLAIG